MRDKILTTTLSSRGQVVIPKEAREGLHEGTPFIVRRDDDIITLKKIDTKAEWAEFEKMIRKARILVKKSGLKEEDVPAIVNRVREEIWKREHS